MDLKKIIIAASAAVVVLAIVLVCIFTLGGDKGDEPDLDTDIGDTNNGGGTTDDNGGNDGGDGDGACNHVYSGKMTFPPCWPDGVRFEECDKCGDRRNEEYIGEPTHTWSEFYNYDDRDHWKYCEFCPEMKDFEEHTRDSEGFCTVCGHENPMAADGVGLLEGIYYKPSSDRTYASVVGCEDDRDTLTIFEYYESMPVVGIEEYAFNGLENVHTINIPASVETAEEYSISANRAVVVYCEAAEKPSGFDIEWAYETPVVWDSRNNEIAEDEYIYAFYGDIRYKLKDGEAYVTLQTLEHRIFDIAATVHYKGSQYTVTAIEPYAFSGCYVTEGRLDIPYSVKVIGKGAFRYTEITELHTSGDLEIIGEDAFKDCDYLSSVILESGLVTIGAGAFEDCTSLSEIMIPRTVAEIGSYAFVGCKALERLTFNIDAGTGMVIGSYAFSGCEKLGSIELSGITKIGDYAFKGCKKIESVYIGDSTEKIGEGAFAGCTSLASFSTAYASPYFKAIDGHLYSADGKVFIQYAIGNGAKSFTPAGGVSRIEGGAFWGADYLENIVLPDTVRSIDNRAFEGCTSLSLLKEGGCTYVGTAENPYFVLLSTNDLEGLVIREDVRVLADSSLLGIECKYGEYGQIINPEIVFHDGIIAVGKNVFPMYYSFYTSYDGCNYVGTEDNPYMILVEVGRQYSQEYSVSALTKIIADGVMNNLTELDTVAFFGTEEGWNEIYKGYDNDVLGKVNVRFLTECRFTHDNVLWNTFTKINNKVDMTCDKNGSYDVEYYCVCCCELIETEHIVEYAPGHSFEDGVCTVCGAGDNYSKGLEFTSNRDGTCLVSGFGTCTDKVVRIPLTSPTGDTVVGIRTFAFSGESQIEEIIFPDTLITIGNYAFDSCSSLKKINLPDTVTEIGGYAFRYCTSLTEIEIPDGVTEISEFTFSYCSSLTMVYLSDSITKIACDAFDNTPVQYYVEDGLNYLGSRENERLVLMSAADKNQSEYTISPDTRVIANNAFANCYSLHTIIIPGTVEHIGEGIFGGCSVRNVVVSEGITRLPTYFLDNCSSVTDLTIPKSVKTIEYAASLGAYNLQYVNYAGTEEEWGNIVFETDGGHYGDSYNDNILNAYKIYNYTGPVHCHEEGELVYEPVTAPTCTAEGVENICKYCTVCDNKLYSVENIILPLGHKYVGNSCSVCGADIQYSENLDFKSLGDGTAYVSGLGSCDDKIIVIPPTTPGGDRVVGIAAYSFNWLDITEVIIPEGVECVEDEAFQGCQNLTKVTIPSTIKYISSNAFLNSSVEYTKDNGCLYLGVAENPYHVLIGVDESAYELQINENTVIISGMAFYECYLLQSITLPSGIKVIGSSAFHNCHNLVSVVISEGTEEICDNAFLNCDNLRNVSLPSGLTSIGDFAFSGAALEKVQIPNSVTTFGTSVFAMCYALSEAEIGNGVDNLPGETFYECSALTKVTLGNNIKSIGSNAFYSCYVLSDLVLPAGLARIDEGAFYGCDSLGTTTLGGCKYIGSEDNPYMVLLTAYDKELTTYEIHGNTQFIAERAFCDCYNLTEIVVPDSVKAIYSHAFGCCYSLKKLTLGSGLLEIRDMNLSDSYDLQYNVFDGVNYLGNDHNPYMVLVSVEDRGKGSYEIKDGTKFILDNAFEYCYAVTDINIPNSVIRIGRNAFYGCEQLRQVSLGSGVEFIGKNAFSGCYRLLNVTLGAECSFSAADWYGNNMIFTYSMISDSEAFKNYLMGEYSESDWVRVD